MTINVGNYLSALLLYYTLFIHIAILNVCWGLRPDQLECEEWNVTPPDFVDIQDNPDNPSSSPSSTSTPSTASLRACTTTWVWNQTSWGVCYQTSFLLQSSLLYSTGGLIQMLCNLPTPTAQVLITSVVREPDRLPWQSQDRVKLPFSHRKVT